MKDSKVSFHIGCLMCGVKKKDHKHKTCGEEAKAANLPLVGNFTAKEHMWTEMKEVSNWYGKGIVPEILK